MNLPGSAQFIDIHTHGSKPGEGILVVENILAHEELLTENITSEVFTAGIHPWYLSKSNHQKHIEYIRSVSTDNRLIGIGEAGFDKLRGPAMDLQELVFSEQVKIASGINKPIIIHCVRSWEILLKMHKSLRPLSPWMVHGFRGKKELASQLLSRGMFISFWVDFVIRPESSDLVRFVPRDRIFLETDGTDTDIRDIYSKVANDLNIEVSELKDIIYKNFNELFGGQKF